jgi:hypothetical protein
MAYSLGAGPEEKPEVKTSAAAEAIATWLRSKGEEIARDVNMYLGVAGGIAGALKGYVDAIIDALPKPPKEVMEAAPRFAAGLGMGVAAMDRVERKSAKRAAGLFGAVGLAVAALTDE